MSIPIDLDPREVLEHLEALGYNHITKDQLKQFIKDLKKLIKYDLRKLRSQEDAENRPVENQIYESPKKSPRQGAPLEKGHRKVLSDRNQAEKPFVETQPKSIAVQTLVPPTLIENASSSMTGSYPVGETGAYPQSGASSQRCSTCKCDSCPSCSQPKSSKKSAGKKKNSAPKPVSSFIRIAPSEARLGKTDPVTLYHYYQSLWAQQNRPGENPHADVRWRIRHKMMAPTALRTCAERRRENPPWVD